MELMLLWRRACADKCVRVLVANGVRLATVRNEYKERIEPWMVALENGRLCCRAVIVVLLGLKRSRGHVLKELDRFVVLKIAICTWTTRGDMLWQTK